MSGEAALEVSIVDVRYIDGKSYTVVEVPCLKALELLRTDRVNVIVAVSESCPKQDVDAIKALCNKRGLVYESDATAAGASSVFSPGKDTAATSGKEKDSAAPGGKEKD